MVKSRVEIQKAYKQRLKEKDNRQHLFKEKQMRRATYIPNCELSTDSNSIKSQMEEAVIVGVDVGETNTDAVVLRGDDVIGWSKQATTADIGSGVQQAVREALNFARQSQHGAKNFRILRAHIGTTLSALGEALGKRCFTPVAAIRLCGPASRALPPFSNFSEELRKKLCASVHMVDGGYNQDGLTEIKEIDEQEIVDVLLDLESKGIMNIAVSGIFSSLNSSQEVRVGGLIEKYYQEASYTLSHIHAIDNEGLLKREKRSIIDESLKPFLDQVVGAFEAALSGIGVDCPVFLTTNYGTLISSERARQTPLLTLTSGSSDRLRGAAFLSGVEDGIVVDIEEKSLYIGVLSEVPTPHASISQEVKSGPILVRRELKSKAGIFGGSILITTEKATAASNKKQVSDVDKEFVKGALDEIHGMVEACLNHFNKPARDDIPVVLIGDSARLLDKLRGMKGVGDVTIPNYHTVARAVGAACCQMKEEGTQPHSAATSVISDIQDQISAIFHESRGAASEVPDREDVISADDQTPTVDQETGEWMLKDYDVDCIAIGAGIIGCGGGGNSELCHLLTKKSLRDGYKIRVITPERYLESADKDNIAIMFAQMGSPKVFDERLISFENITVIKCLRDIYQGNKNASGTEGRSKQQNCDVMAIDKYDVPSWEAIVQYKDHCLPPVAALLAAEIGGSNGLQALWTGGYLDLRVLDCDSIGRAFPELQDSASFINGHPVHPACLGDCFGRHNVVLEAPDAQSLENYYRDVCIEMGGSATIGLSPFCIQDLKSSQKNRKKVVLYSISRAWWLGRAVLESEALKESPIDAILEMEGGKLLITGKITERDDEPGAGFTSGTITISGYDKYAGESLDIDFKNENLVAYKTLEEGRKEALATTPDLISLVDTSTNRPLFCETMDKGMSVAVLVLPAPPQLTTPQALEKVGPKAFGYDFEYHPVADFKEPTPVTDVVWGRRS